MTFGGGSKRNESVATLNNYHLYVMTNTNTSFVPQSHSHQQVLRSAAGWYVGTLYFDTDLHGYFPNSRDTDYFPSYEEAQAYLVWSQIQEQTVYCHVCDYPNDLEQDCCHNCGAVLSEERGDA